MVAQALRYAKRGWHVHPLWPRRKEPLTRWRDEATTDEDTIREWWRVHPNANIGIVTGKRSGLLVIDLDGREAARAFDALCEEHGGLPATRIVYTGRGNGQHVYLRANEEVRSRTHSLPFEVKGEGTYIVAPPSVHPSGQRYKLAADDSAFDREPADAPQWLLNAIRADAPAVDAGEGSDRSTSGPNARAALRAEAKAVREAPPPTQDSPGDRNNALNRAAFAMGQHVGAGVIDRERVERKLAAAAREAGLGEVEIGGTLASGLDAGEAQPRPAKDQAHRPRPKSKLVTLDTVDPTDIEWIWPPYLPLGKLAILDADGGSGKSTLTLALAAAISTGGQMPDGHRMGRGNVLLINSEDDASDTIVPRLINLEAKRSRIAIVEGDRPRLDDGGLEELERHIDEWKPVLVVLDPLQAFLPEGVDMNRANHTRQPLERAHEIAERHRTTILFVRHFTKGERGKAMHKGLGSVDIMAAMRSGLICIDHPTDPDKRIMAHAKCNVAPLGKSQCYRIIDDGGVGRFEWCGESEHTADELIREEERAALRPSAPKLDEAMEFLHGRLEHGEAPATELIGEAEAEGISERTLRDAKRALGVVSRKRKDPDTGKIRSYWRWPGEHEPLGGKGAADKCEEASH